MVQGPDLGGGKPEGFDAQDRHMGEVSRQRTLCELDHSVGANGEGDRNVIVGRSRPGSWRKIYLSSRV